MRRIDIFVVACAASLSFSTCLAQESHSVGTMGAGNASCGSWGQWRHGEDIASIAKFGAVQGWVHGYMSAMAAEHEKINAALHQTDSAGIDGWIDNWCSAHPLSSVAQAANALAFDLSR
jgi:hypothetical protein